jgi:hypothetical protein
MFPVGVHGKEFVRWPVPANSGCPPLVSKWWRTLEPFEILITMRLPHLFASIFPFALSTLVSASLNEQVIIPPMSYNNEDGRPDSPFTSSQPTLADLLTIETSASIYYSYARETDLASMFSSGSVWFTMLVPTNKAVMALARKPWVFMMHCIVLYYYTIIRCDHDGVMMMMRFNWLYGWFFVSQTSRSGACRAPTWDIRAGAGRKIQEKCRAMGFSTHHSCEFTCCRLSTSSFLTDM